MCVIKFNYNVFLYMYFSFVFPSLLLFFGDPDLPLVAIHSFSLLKSKTNSPSNSFFISKTLSWIIILISFRRTPMAYYLPFFFFLRYKEDFLLDLRNKISSMNHKFIFLGAFSFFFFFLWKCWIDFIFQVVVLKKKSGEWDLER